MPATLTPSFVRQARLRNQGRGKSLPWAEATMRTHAGPQSIASYCRVNFTVSEDLFFGLLGKVPAQGEHDVARDIVDPCLCTALLIYIIGYVLDFSEDVVAVEYQHKLVAHKRFGDPGVPHKLVGVHLVIVKTACRIHLQVGADLKPGRQTNASAHSVAVGSNSEGIEETLARGGSSCLDLSVKGSHLFLYDIFTAQILRYFQ